VVSLAVALLAASLVSAAQEPKEAGKDVPAPHRVKLVQPKYPPEALARGERAIVVLEIVVDEDGRVSDAKVVHGTPEFGQAALDAVRQWRYEVTKIAGHAVPVRLTVPLSFASKLPEMTREAGIPELRHGVGPALPAENAARGGSAVARVEIDAEGRVAQSIVQRGESPWREALLAAVQTWRFAPPEHAAGLAFEVHADFKPGHPPTVDLALTNPSALEGAVAAADTSVEQAAPAAAAPAAAQDVSGQAGPVGARTEVPAPGVPMPKATVPPGVDTSTPEQPTADPRATASAPPPSPRPRSTPAGTRAPVEIIHGSAPAPAVPVGTAAPGQVPVVENGGSSVREVALGAGLPDLVKGRRPVAPPLVRISGEYGDVDVRFSIDSGGATSVTSSEGPDALKEAAEGVVKSWSFRRASANRVYAVAHVHYAADGSSAKVEAAE
jgi:TonB family protein